MSLGTVSNVGINIFPSPVIDKLSISTTLQNKEYKIYDLTGLLIVGGLLDSGSLDVSRLKTVVYFLTLRHPMTDRLLQIELSSCKKEQCVFNFLYFFLRMLSLVCAKLLGLNILILMIFCIDSLYKVESI